MHLVANSQMCTFAPPRTLPHFKTAGGANNRLPWMRQRQPCCWWQIGRWGDEFADEPSGTSAGARWRGRGLGGASNLQLQPPTPPHSLPIPHPETPQLNKVPQVTPILAACLLLGEEETKETKILGGRPPDRELNLHINLQDERTRRVRNFKLATFDTFLVCWISFFEPLHLPVQ